LIRTITGRRPDVASSAANGGLALSSSNPAAGVIRDRPADLRVVDPFSHEDYASAAAETLNAADRTFTLGLFGDWGLGKTTIIRRLGELVQTQGLAFVDFDVWRFEGDALRRQFLREAARQLKEQGYLPRRYKPSKELRDLEVDVPVVQERLRLSLRGILRATVIGSLIGVAFYAFFKSGAPETLFDRSTTSSTANEVGVLVGLASFLYNLLSQMLLVEQRMTTVRRIEEPERFYSKFRELLQQVKVRRVVIAIDNLDRCSPTLVDTMLSTIKTYLEPAQDEVWAQAQHSDSKMRFWRRHERAVADAVFVIAADDAAVRRHMVGREMESLPSTLESKQQRATLTEAERRVDEYLRKFFDASIRLRPILQEDIRHYARTEMERVIVYARANVPPGADPEVTLSTEVEGRLISLVTSALRRNPRRIKQFANSLETRLRTIKAREHSGGISRDHPVSGDLLGIAKLVVIEEEWRDRYEAIEANPRRLSEWQTEARSGDLDEPSFAAFLRDTRDITPANVGAVVNLKLESDELELEGFAVFRDAIVHGDHAAAREVLDGADSAKQTEYTNRLPELYRRELQIGGALTEARNVLDAALQDPPLGLGDADQLTRMVSDAVTTPRLLAQLPQLDVDRVFAVMHRLRIDERVQARGPFLNLGEIGSQFGVSAVRQIAQELGQVAHELTSSEREILGQPIGVDPIASQLRSSILPLLNSDPTLVSEPALQLAWASLSSGFDPRGAEFELTTLGFSAGRGASVVAAFLGSLNTYFASVISDGSRHQELTEALLGVVRRLGVVDDSALHSIVQSVQNNFAALVQHDASHAAAFALEFAGQLLKLSEEAPASAAAAEELIRVAVSQVPFEVVSHLRGRT
jgi:hypothetical protein